MKLCEDLGDSLRWSLTPPLSLVAVAFSSQSVEFFLWGGSPIEYAKKAGELSDGVDIVGGKAAFAHICEVISIAAESGNVTVGVQAKVRSGEDRKTRVGARSVISRTTLLTSQALPLSLVSVAFSSQGGRDAGTLATALGASEVNKY